MKRLLKIAGNGRRAHDSGCSVSGTFGASYYYSSEHGQGCASCHEMAAYVSEVHGAPHRKRNVHGLPCSQPIDQAPSYPRSSYAYLAGGDSAARRGRG
jgi:hypothetical protein